MINNNFFSDDSLWHLAIQQYYSKTVNFVYHLTGDQFIAEDIAQEAFATANVKFEQLRDTDKFFPWLTSIALNLVRTQIKRDQRVISISEIDSCFYSEVACIIEMCEKKERQKLVQNAIAQLPAQQKEMTIMRYYLDMKDKEIAFALGVTSGSVKKQLFRARAKLYLTLQNSFLEEGDKDAER